MTDIGGSAFRGCTGLTSITVSPENTVYHSTNNCLIETDKKMLITGCKNSVIPADGSVASIDYDAFYDCTGLTSITIPDSVTSIGDSAFYDCSGLTSVTIGNSVTSIGEQVFHRCTSLTSVTIGSSVTSIGYEAFYECTNLTSITIPDSVTSIGSFAFSGCTGLTSITIPDSVTSIGGYAFAHCTGLTSITIPDSVTSIGDSAFSGCTSLTSITIPDSVTSIGDYAFNGCTGLTNIKVPASVTDIGDKAFGYYWAESESVYGYVYGYEKLPNFTIYGYTGTAAETYANENGFEFIALDEEHTHTYSDWAVTTEPTCTAEGEETRTCSVCGESETRTIEKAAHKIVIDTSVTPTCTKTGVTEGQHCSVCGEVLVEQQTIAAAGHNDNNSDGICDSCGEDLGTHTPSENCSCACHKGGIEKLFFKIALFFQKLFKKNQVCKCGVWHY